MVGVGRGAQCRRADQERRSAGAPGEGRHPRHRQDRHADRGQAEASSPMQDAGRPQRRPSCCASPPASSAPANIRWPPRSSRRRASAAWRSPRPAEFDAPAGKGVTGIVDGRYVTIGNRAMMARARHRHCDARCRGGARCARTAPPRSSSPSTARPPASSPSPIRSSRRRRTRSPRSRRRGSASSC